MAGKLPNRVASIGDLVYDSDDAWSGCFWLPVRWDEGAFGFAMILFWPSIRQYEKKL